MQRNKNDFTTRAALLSPSSVITLFVQIVKFPFLLPNTISVKIRSPTNAVSIGWIGLKWLAKNCPPAGFFSACLNTVTPNAFSKRWACKVKRLYRKIENRVHFYVLDLSLYPSSSSVPAEFDTIITFSFENVSLQLFQASFVIYISRFPGEKKNLRQWFTWKGVYIVDTYGAVKQLSLSNPIAFMFPTFFKFE